MWREERDIVVVGGGISGLTVAWHLNRGGADVSLIEADSEVGGAIRTESRDGFLLEKGPFNVMVRDPAFERLLDGLADRVTVVTASDKAKNRYIYRHGRLHAVPTGPFAGGVRRLDARFTMALASGDWVLAVARGDRPMTFLPRAGARPFAFTNAVWIR